MGKGDRSRTVGIDPAAGDVVACCSPPASGSALLQYPKRTPEVIGVRDPDGHGGRTAEVHFGDASLSGAERFDRSLFETPHERFDQRCALQNGELLHEAPRISALDVFAALQAPG